MSVSCKLTKAFAFGTAMGHVAAMSASASTVSLSIPSSLPSSARGPISHSWLGFGIEGESFQYYGGYPDPDTFSQNMIDTISNRTGAPSVIRIGGTSLDHSKLDPNQAQPALGTGNGHPRSISIGPSFFELYDRFPNSQYTMMVPFAPENLTYTTLFAKSALPHVGTRLSSIEIGNEPDQYPGVDRPSAWTLPEYAMQWEQYASALEKLSIPAGPIFEGLSFSEGVLKNHPTWTVQNVYKDGYFNHTRLKTISEHYYQVHDNVDLAGTLLNHSYTVNQTNRFRSPINFLATHEPNVSFILGEVGSGLEGGGKVNDSGNFDFADGLGTAVWTLDWMLYAMSIGVTAVSMQQGVNFTFSAWIPAPAFGRGPVVHSPFMAFVAVADFIGTDSAPLHVTALQTNDPHISAYAGYRGKGVTQVIVNNLQIWNGTGTRPLTTVAVPVTNRSATSVTVRRLTGSNTYAQKNVTWAGETWSYESNGLPVRLANATEVAPVKNGVAMFQIAASEGVMIDVS